MMKLTKDGGQVIWAEKQYIFKKQGDKLVAPHKIGYNEIMKNTTKEFFDKYVI